MVAAVGRLLTLIVVVLMFIIIVPLVGPFLVTSMPQFAEVVGQILGALWDGALQVLHSFGS